MKTYKTSLVFPQQYNELEEFHSKYLKDFDPKYLSYYDDVGFSILIVLNVEEEQEGDLLCLSLQAGLNITSIDERELAAMIRRRIMQPLDKFLRKEYLIY